MNNQSIDKPEAISWQFVALIAALAFVAVLVAAGPIPHDQVPPPQPPLDIVMLNPESLSEVYSDAYSGISIDYPQGWVISQGEGGGFMLSNYRPQTGDSTSGFRSPVNAEETIISFIPVPRSSFFARFGISEDRTLGDFLENEPSITGDVGPVEAAGLQGWHAHTLTSDSAYELEIVLLDSEDTVIWLQGESQAGAWDNHAATFDRVLESMRLPGLNANTSEDAGSTIDQNSTSGDTGNAADESSAPDAESGTTDEGSTSDSGADSSSN